MQYLQLCQNLDIGLAVWKLREERKETVMKRKGERQEEREEEMENKGGEGGVGEREGEGDREVPGRGLVLVS